jgi:transposase
MVAYFVKTSPCLIGMEACGSAHYCVRELQKQGLCLSALLFFIRSK